MGVRRACAFVFHSSSSRTVALPHAASLLLPFVLRMADARSESSYSYYDDPPASSNDVVNDEDAPQEEGERYDEDELYSQYSSAGSSSQQYSPARSSSQYSYDSYSPAPSDRPANMPQRPMLTQPPKPPLMRIADALRSPHPAPPPPPAQPHFSNRPPSQQASRSQLLDPTSEARASSPVQPTASNPTLTSHIRIHVTPALQDQATSTAPPIAGQDQASSTGGLSAPCMQERAMSAEPPLPVMHERATSTSGRSCTISGTGASAEPDGDDPMLRASEAELARCVFELARSAAPRLL